MSSVRALRLVPCLPSQNVRTRCKLMRGVIWEPIDALSVVWRCGPKFDGGNLTRSVPSIRLGPKRRFSGNWP
jgi:hypothetical protein